MNIDEIEKIQKGLLILLALAKKRGHGKARSNYEYALNSIDEDKRRAVLSENESLTFINGILNKEEDKNV